MADFTQDGFDNLYSQVQTIAAAVGTINNLQQELALTQNALSDLVAQVRALKADDDADDGTLSSRIDALKSSVDKIRLKIDASGSL